MGAAFVKRRMMAELGAGLARALRRVRSEAGGRGLARPGASRDDASTARRSPASCNIRTWNRRSRPISRSSRSLFALHRRMNPVIDTTRDRQGDRRARPRGARLRAARPSTSRSTAPCSPTSPEVRVPAVEPELSTRRLLTMRLARRRADPRLHKQDAGRRSATASRPRCSRPGGSPFSHHGVIHGDPHLGNYTVFSEGGEPQGINLLDYGCIRIFPPALRRRRGRSLSRPARRRRCARRPCLRDLGLQGADQGSRRHPQHLGALHLRAAARGSRPHASPTACSPAEYGRKQAFQVHQALKERGPVTVPREFVFMDRAAIGLGGVFLHLDAELNFHRLFEAEIERLLVERAGRAAGDGAGARRAEAAGLSGSIASAATSPRRRNRRFRHRRRLHESRARRRSPRRRAWSARGFGKPAPGFLLQGGIEREAIIAIGNLARIVHGKRLHSIARLTESEGSSRPGPTRRQWTRQDATSRPIGFVRLNRLKSPMAPVIG